MMITNYILKYSRNNFIFVSFNLWLHHMAFLEFENFFEIIWNQPELNF